MAIPRIVLLLTLVLLDAGALSAQKGPVPTSTGSIDLTPRGLYAAQIEPKAITLSWYAPRLPANFSGEQFILCNVGGRDMRPQQKSWAKEVPLQTEPLLQTFVLPATSEVPHRCRLELRTRSGSVKSPTGDQVKRYEFNEVTPKLSPTPAPPTPTDVVPTLVSPGRVRVTWSASSNATAYTIQRQFNREGVRTICYMCPPVQVYMDTLPASRGPVRVQYLVTALGISGRSRPATSRSLEFGGLPGTVAASDTSGPLPTGVAVGSIASGPVPGTGQVMRTLVQQTEKTVTEIVRLGPVAGIPEHHHPHYNETAFVHAGELEVVIGTHRQYLRAGQVAYIPAGTTMRALNTSRVNEAQVVVVYSNVGTTGPLMVSGPGGN